MTEVSKTRHHKTSFLPEIINTEGPHLSVAAAFVTYCSTFGGVKLEARCTSIILKDVQVTEIFRIWFSSLIVTCRSFCACICITTGDALFEKVIKVKFGRVELVAVFLNLFYLCF